jgi:hypothetical protein
VAKLEPAEADALLQWCIDPGAPGRPRTIADLRDEINRRDPKVTRAIVKISPPLAQPLSARVRRLLALESADASQTTQPEQASAARPLALPAPEQPQCEPPSTADTLSETPQPELPSPATALAVLAQERRQREPDARWTIIISALEHALTIAQSPEDRERFQDALNAAQEVRANYLWR